QMSYVGYDKGRETVKYRCPARHEGRACPGGGKRSAGRDRGLTARPPCDLGLRRLPPIPRATKACGRLYRGRAAVGRGSGRLRICGGAADGPGAGARRVRALGGGVRGAPLLFATLRAKARRGGGTRGQTRLGPVAEAPRPPEPATVGG